MIEATVDLWAEEADARCITTNGIVNNGSLVMGGGTALQAKERYPLFPEIAGDFVIRWGNRVHHLWVPRADRSGDDHFFTFPTKNHYRDPSDMELIEASARELMQYLDKHISCQRYKKVLLPRPGVGLGGLKWEDVKPVIEPILDDRVWVISNG